MPEKEIQQNKNPMQSKFLALICFDLVLACTHQFVKMTAVDLHHFPFIPQTSDIILEVQLNTRLRRRRDRQSDRITIHQAVLNLRRLGAVHFKARRVVQRGSQQSQTKSKYWHQGQKFILFFGVGRFGRIKHSLTIFQIYTVQISLSYPYLIDLI